MNALYERYRQQPGFREALVAAARRDRNAALARFIAAAAAYFSPTRDRHAARPHLARQG
jgi:hypothetical protein